MKTVYFMIKMTHQNKPSMSTKQKPPSVAMNLMNCGVTLYKPSDRRCRGTGSLGRVGRGLGASWPSQWASVGSRWWHCRQGHWPSHCRWCHLRHSTLACVWPSGDCCCCYCCYPHLPSLCGRYRDISGDSCCFLIFWHRVIHPKVSENCIESFDVS